MLALTAAMLGTADVAMVGADCTTDYLIIPNPSGVTTDRFCGMALVPVTSTYCKMILFFLYKYKTFFFVTGTPPFVLYYITDAADGNDAANRGFSLQYSQNSCPISAKK